MASRLPPKAQGSATPAFCAAWLFLNVLININYPAPLPYHRLALVVPSVDVIVLLGGLCLAVARGMRPSVLPGAIFVCAVVFLRLFRLGDVLVPMYFNRPFNLYMDTGYVPDLLNLLKDTLSPAALAAWSVLTVALLAGTCYGVWQAFEVTCRYFSRRVHRRIFMVVSLPLLTLPLVWCHPPGNESDHLFPRSMVPRIIQETDFILRLHDIRAAGRQALEAGAARAAMLPSSLNRLNGTDVYLFFVESYGQVVFSKPDCAATLVPRLHRLERSLAAHGYSMVSNFISSPTLGGTSWLAHGTLATGVLLDTQIQFDLLLHARVKPLAGYFNDAGYDTLHVMPGTTLPWPAGEVFQFKRRWYAWQFDYQGPAYGWSTMPDQYVLDFIWQREIEHRQAPLFVEYVLGSSHAPFHRQPPVIDDWSKIGDGRIYHRVPPVTFPVVWPDLSNAGEAYVSALTYEFDVFESYLTRRLTEDALIIILGDHQPNLQLLEPAPCQSVPIHVISRDRDLLAPFAARGYSPGLVPRQPLPHAGMETFLHGFLSDMSRR